MAVATYTKSGAKAAAPAKLDKAVFGVPVDNHQLLKDAYLSHLANRRTNNAVAKRRGEVRGGGRKPWRQKGTGNARFGSIRNPIWRGGGVAFGPTGSENYSRRLSTSARRQALRHALSLAAKEERIKVIDSLAFDGKTKSAAKLFKKIEAAPGCLVVTADKEAGTTRAVRNLPGVNLIAASHLNTYDVLNASCLVFEKPALETLSHSLEGVK